MTVYLPLEIDVGECLPIGIAAFVSSATQGGGKAGVAGINSFGQGLLERRECVFKCLAEGAEPSSDQPLMPQSAPRRRAIGAPCAIPRPNVPDRGDVHMHQPIR